MITYRRLQLLLIAFGIIGLFYLAISLYLPSPGTLIFGIDRKSGEIRIARGGIAFLPPHIFRRNAFSSREGAAQMDGVASALTRENVPIRVQYRVRFLVTGAQLPDSRRIVVDGWRYWFDRRVAEALRAVTTQVSVEELASPGARFAERRSALTGTAISHLERNGIDVKAFEIGRITIDKGALLEHKRQQIRRQARGPVGRVAVIGVDGLDWELLDALIDVGRMPTMKSVIENGASARLQSIQPTASALVWTSLSTGLAPSRTGIVGGAETAAAPATRRNAPAFWEIAAGFNRPADVVDWWAAWPPVRMDNLVVVQPDEGMKLETWPAEVAAIVADSRVPIETVGPDQLGRFAEVGNDLQGGSPTVLLREVLARTWTSHRVALRLVENDEPMLLAVGFPGADVVHHVFGPYSPPQRSGVDRDMYRRYWPVLINFYVELDRLLGEWLRALPEDSTLLIVSAHGSMWGDDRPRLAPDERNTLGDHRDTGVLIAFGNAVRPSRARIQASILDVTPTILSLLGLPKSTEMDGRSLDSMFTDVEPIEAVQVVSYSDLIDLEAPRASGDLARGLEMRHQRLAGHLHSDSSPQTARRTAAATERPETWGRYAWLNNEGVRKARAGDLAEAIDLFDDATSVVENDPTAYLNLLSASLANNRITAAENLVEKILEENLVDDPEQLVIDLAAWFRADDRNMPTRAINVLSEARERFPGSYRISANLGSALAEGDRLTDAVPILEEALALRPTSTAVLNNLGNVYARRDDPARALDYWNRSLAINPRQPPIIRAVNAATARL